MCVYAQDTQCRRSRRTVDEAGNEQGDCSKGFGCRILMFKEQLYVETLFERGYVYISIPERDRLGELEVERYTAV